MQTVDIAVDADSARVSSEVLVALSTSINTRVETVAIDTFAVRRLKTKLAGYAATGNQVVTIAES